MFVGRSSERQRDFRELSLGQLAMTRYTVSFCNFWESACHIQFSVVEASQRFSRLYALL